VGSHLISLPHDSVKFLRPLSVLEVSPNGDTKDVTLRLCTSYLGEDLFLDEDKSYVILAAAPGNRSYFGYGGSTPWGDHEDSAYVARMLKSCQSEIINSLICRVSLNNWSTNLGRRPNFSARYISTSQWRQVWVNYSYYVVTNDFDKLEEVAPWVGTKSESFILRNFARMHLESKEFKSAPRRIDDEQLKVLNSVLSSSWATEPPPLIMNYDCLDEFLASYKRAYNTSSKGMVNHKNYASEVNYIIHMITSFYELVNRRMDDNSIWRWLKNFTSLHPAQEEVEHRYTSVLDSNSKRDLTGEYGACFGGSQWSFPGRHLEAIASIKTDTPLIRALKSQLYELVKVVVQRDNSLNLNWKALREEYKLSAESCVRRKGSVKRGEYILREIMGCVEQTLLSSLPMYKKWYTGVGARVGKDYERAFYGDNGAISPGVIDERVQRMSSRSSYRAGLFLAWCLQESLSPNREEAKVPLTIRRALEDPSKMTVSSLVHISAGLAEAGFTSRVLPYLKELVSRYYETEEATRSVSLTSLDSTFAVTEVNKYGQPEPSSPSPMSVTGYSTIAEMIYRLCRKLERSLPEEVGELLDAMAKHMGRLLVEEKPQCLRKEYRIILLRELADPGHWVRKA